ncbi:MAG: DUF2079 domain-containing protein, partial [Patescibacteria group bacterium]|nr:DUF2079 domain-containing protein [Patescibacteria group bacterium]
MGKLKILYQKYTGGVVFFLILFYTIIFALISVWKYINYNYNALDLAIINQVFYNTNLGNLFASSIHPPTYLTDHFELIILLLSPIYRIWPQPLILLILQTITMAISAWPIYLISKKHLNKNWAVLLVLVWLTNPFVQSINLFEFHILPFAIPLILLSFYYFDQEKFWPFLITSAISLLVREDVALVILMFGILAIVQRKKTKWWLWPIVLSVTYFAAVMKINQLIAPDGQYKFFVYYAWLGSSWPEIIKNAIFKPWLIIRHLITLPSFEFIIGLLMPFALLPLLKSEYLILGAAIFAQLVLGASGGSATILQVHYPALLLPSLFIATIFAIKKILAEKNQTKNKVIKLINQDRHLSFIIFLAAFVYSSLTLGPLPGSLTKITQRGWILPE